MNEDIKQADQDYDAKRFREAVDGYTKAIDVEPSNVDAYNGLARCWLNLRAYDQVVNACGKGLQIDPQNARLHGNLGYAYLHLGRLSESDTEFRRAVSLDPQLIPAQLGLVGVLGRQRKYLEAEAPLRHVIEIEPDNVTALCALRLVNLQLRRMPEALSLARQLYSLAPGPGSLYDYLDTQVLAHRIVAGGVLAGLSAIALLLSGIVSVVALSCIIAIFAWIGVRFFRTGQPREVVGMAIISALLVVSYVLSHGD